MKGRQLPPGRYRARKVSEGEVDYQKHTYVTLPKNFTIRSDELLIFEVIDPETHDHDGHVNHTRINGELAWRCDVCEQIFTPEQYEEWLFRKRTKKWLEEHFKNFDADDLSEDPRQFYQYLMNHLGEL